MLRSVAVEWQMVSLLYSCMCRQDLALHACFYPHIAERFAT